MDAKPTLPQFPHYSPPVSHGVPVAPPKFHTPLYKMMKMMLKPPKQVFHSRKKALTSRTKRDKKRTRFY